LRQADGVPRQPERRGPGDRGQGRAGQGEDPLDDRGWPAPAAERLLLMAKKGKRVFILGGGAALGAHHVGAIKLLEEEGIKPDVIVASSIGVINACAYATGGVPALEEAWNQFRSLPL